ncbi:TetR/AcrR family transcriptional regulator [Cryptosporangium aurantiacum]|uniref:Transcriptional regulator, TetR family n=1 Tax=Cryptosporangium aurantiacum TaxID=134849 RepID=A0A1M7TUF8_9ACTN|nr:TetR/AcrR family transcriptional regulator [Cryptosporangium aurantiacum]SHN74345.1 transcriptional regulator, TetR family [Cryptosporangium aurantiacum]
MSSSGGPTPPKDPRARRSRQALERALLDLVAEQDLAQISVSDITKQAGLSRSTFYEHYVDVHDLAASACTLLFDQLVEGLPMADPGLVEKPDPPDNPLVPVFSHFATHAPLYRSLLGPDGSARVINHLVHRLRAATRANLRFAAQITPRVTGAPGTPPDDPTYALIAGAIVGIVVDWLRHETPDTPEQLAARVWPHLVGAAEARESSF